MSTREVERSLLVLLVDVEAGRGVGERTRGEACLPSRRHQYFRWMWWMTC